MAANDPAPAVATKPGRFCLGCGYDLRGIASERCPECGLRFDHGAGFTIPWQRRKEIGRIRAFWHTVVLATLRPGKLALAAAGPVDYPTAQLFRWIVVAIASLFPIVLFLTVVWHKGGTRFLDIAGRSPDSPWQEIVFIWSAGATLVPTLPFAVLLMFYLWTGAAGYWFLPSQLEVLRQNRAVALSRYACGALAWLPLPLITMGILVAPVLSGGSPTITVRDWLLLGDMFGLIVVSSWCSSLVLLARSTHCGRVRVAAAAIVLPLTWAVAVVIGLGLLPFLVGFVWIVIDSVR